jgi:poly-gamma-glutamate capsule biosynthesis protein CapA/YwtB (metallophosphatase superfamily)
VPAWLLSPRRLRPLLLALLLLAPFAQLQAPEPDLAAYPWVYLRSGAPLQPGEALVSLVAVGDLNLGRGVVAGGALELATPWLRAADLALANLECAFLPAGKAAVPEPGSAQTGYPLLAPQEALLELPAAGFDLLGLANNHAADAGLTALFETYRRLRAAGIAPLGAPENAYLPHYRQVNGLRLAFLAFNAVASPGEAGATVASLAEEAGPQSGGPAGCACSGDAQARQAVAPPAWDLERAAAAVQVARRQAEAVIVSLHWGYEYQPRADPAQVAIADRLFAAGADLIVGHHPHVVQEIAAWPRPIGEPGLVAYSLGNFLFDQGQGQTGTGLALRAFIDSRGLRAVQALPLAAGLRPRLLDPAAAASLVQTWQPQATPTPRPFASSPDCSKPTCQFARRTSPPGALAGASQKLAWHCSADACQPDEPLPAVAGALFQGGAIDLTGNGSPEQLRLEDGRLTILQGSEVAWESPPEWRIADLAPGDPDGDGRAELALALWKPDEAGAWRSHPFLLGYRGGLYRTIWGGSAVGDPILEVELGDVDQDGEQELLVLEEQRGGSGRAISVWRWHGWGFLLQWRSPFGAYEQLRYVEGEGGRGQVVVEEGLGR